MKAAVMMPVLPAAMKAAEIEFRAQSWMIGCVDPKIKKTKQKKEKTMSAKYPIGSQWRTRSGRRGVVCGEADQDEAGNELIAVAIDDGDNDGCVHVTYIFTKNGTEELDGEESGDDLISPFLPSAKSTAMCYVINGVIIAGVDSPVTPDAKFLLTYDAATKGMEVAPAT